MNIMLFGPPGSGKGTQAELLSKEFNIPIVTPGKIYREEAAKKTPFGLEMKEKYWGKGNLVPDEITINIVKKRLKEEGCKDGFVLDGYPRNVAQAKILKEIAKMDYIFYIKVSKEELIKRMAARRICSCGAWFDLRVKPPKEDGLCDNCGRKLLIRSDDTPEIIGNRFEVYQKQTMPMLNFYSKELIEINGEQPIEDVFKDMMNSVKS